MKITKLKLDFDYDFHVFVLISSVKDYKLAWHLNKTLNLHLRKGNELCLDFLHESKIYISNFIFEKEYSSFRLLKNKACEHINVSKPYLLPELKEYDYIIVLKDEGGTWDLDQVFEQIKSISAIQYIKKVEPDNLKSKENLIFS